MSFLTSMFKTEKPVIGRLCWTRIDIPPHHLLAIAQWSPPCRI